MNNSIEDKIYFEPDGRMYKKERFTRKVPRYTFVKGYFVGKFHADLKESDSEKGEFFEFKIYEGNVEILEKEKTQKQIKKEDYNTVKIHPEQMPEKGKLLFFEKIDGKKVYYNLNFQEPTFTNFNFISKFQQNDGEEAYGTVEADFHGYLVDYKNIELYKKRYKKIKLNVCTQCIETSEKTGRFETKEDGRVRHEFWCKGKKETFWGRWENFDCIKSSEKTGNIEKKGECYREEYWCLDKKYTFWGEWICDECSKTLEETGNIERKGLCYRKEYWCKGKLKTYWGEWICDECIKTNNKTGKKERREGSYREEYWCEGNLQTYWGEWIYEGEKSFCMRSLLIALILLLGSIILDFTPLIIIGFLWFLYVIYRCNFNLLKYLAYLVALLFFIGLVYSILNINWDVKSEPYIPSYPTVHQSGRPKLVKVITLLDDKNNPDIVFEKEMVWYGYNGEKYQGKYAIRKTDLETSRNFKNSMQPTSYESMLYNLYSHDSERINGIYKMFSSIRDSRKMNDKQFAEMVVSFIQYMPYYVVLDKSCNPSDYNDHSISTLIKQNPGRCSPNNRFGITTPVEFLTTGQGDCDSRTLLAHTILKHFGFETAILSSDIYKHSILGINLPYSGMFYDSGYARYSLWETTNINFSPGNIPVEVSNTKYWSISLK